MAYDVYVLDSSGRVVTTPATSSGSSNLSDAEIADLLYSFPRLYQQALTDWAKFKLGVARGAFDTKQIREVIDYYKGFARYWEMIRPNFFAFPDGRPKPDHAVNYAKGVDAWLNKFNSDVKTLGLGIAPLVIAGILIAGSLASVAAISWAVSYIKQQSNISALIDARTKGLLTPDEFETAINAEERIGGITNPFSEAADLLKWGIVFFGIYSFAPMIRDFLSRRKKGATA